jgi:hypothetical protein
LEEGEYRKNSALKVDIEVGNFLQEEPSFEVNKTVANRVIIAVSNRVKAMARSLLMGT